MKNGLEEFQEGQLWSTESEGSLTIGATQSALEEIGALAGIELGELGDEYSAGDWIGELQGKDGSIEITAPCNLKIVERNEQVMAQHSLLEDDPTGDAWLLRVERAE